MRGEGDVKKKILVVEDEQDVAKVLKGRLKSAGYDVVIASDSVQGVTMTRKERPNLILLDVMIPGGGGFAVAERLKQSPDTCDIPIIVLTGIPGTEEKAYQVGASFHFNKPYKPEELLDAIRTALERGGKKNSGSRLG
jgi:two-component system alkaline phosphatase synthesis response regulator PhoP